MKIKLKSTGDWGKTFNFFDKSQKILEQEQLLNRIGQLGVDALKKASPVETGLMKESWSYKVKMEGKRYRIDWENDDVENGGHVALLVQYGHIANGTWIEGQDYINPAMTPIFNEFENIVWKEIRKL